MFFVPIEGIQRRSSNYLKLIEILKLELELNPENYHIIFNFNHKDTNYIKGIYFENEDIGILFKLRYDKNEFRKN